MNRSKDWPHWSYPTARAFRATKRRQAREALRALHALQCGCFYTPTEGRIPQAMKLIREALEAMSVKRWKR